MSRNPHPPGRNDFTKPTSNSFSHKQRTEKLLRYAFLWFLWYRCIPVLRLRLLQLVATFLYIANHLSYKCCNDLDIYKKNELESN